jgi:hypothetical protein
MISILRINFGITKFQSFKVRNYCIFVDINEFEISGNNVPLIILLQEMVTCYTLQFIRIFDCQIIVSAALDFDHLPIISHNLDLIMEHYSDSIKKSTY